MVAAIPNGTDVWMAVPASPPLRMTIRACLDDRCEECRLPIYRCRVRGRAVAASLRKSSPTAELIGCSAVRRYSPRRHDGLTAQSSIRSGWSAWTDDLLVPPDLDRRKHQDHRQQRQQDRRRNKAEE